MEYVTSTHGKLDAPVTPTLNPNNAVISTDGPRLPSSPTVCTNSAPVVPSYATTPHPAAIRNVLGNRPGSSTLPTNITAVEGYDWDVTSETVCASDVYAMRTIVQ